MKSFCFFLVLLILFVLKTKAQDSSDFKPKFYTDLLLVKVLTIDTLTLVSDSYLTNIGMPVDNFKAVRVSAEVISWVEGSFTRRKVTMMMDVVVNEHSCSYSFSKGSRYRVYVYSFRYSSKDILKKYRKQYFKIDCYYPPVEVDENK